MQSKQARMFQILTLSLLFAPILPAVFAASEEKPVKVYILAGQSNMVGIGQVGPMGATRFNTYVSDKKNAEKGVTLSIYEGEYDPTIDYEEEKVAETHKVMLGYWPHTAFPTIDGPSVSIARGFIRIDRKGAYSFRTTHNTILELDGEVIFRHHDNDEITTSKRVTLEPGTYPIKVTFLGAARSNMGHTIWDTPGTLTTLVKQQGLFPYLINEDGEWAERDDVWYKGVITAGASKWLNIGCGANTKQIGPELGFGHALGNYHEEPVLIIKASQGNRSLAWDFLPPGSERFEKNGYMYAGYKDPKSRWEAGTEPETGGWYAGKQYDDCFSAVHEVLENFDDHFPHWAGQGYEVAGFGWWQGHKDTGNDVHAERYEQNLVQLIQSLRKEFAVPNAPFVVATIGFDGWDMDGNTLTVTKAQLAVSGTAGNYPEFSGNVKSVDTRNFWPEASNSPRNQGYHYHQNAGTYMLVGEAMGKGMVELLRN